MPGTTRCSSLSNRCCSSLSNRLSNRKAFTVLVLLVLAQHHHLSFCAATPLEVPEAAPGAAAAVPLIDASPNDTAVGAIVATATAPSSALPTHDAAAGGSVKPASHWWGTWWTRKYNSLSRAVQVASKISQMTTLLAAVNAVGMAGPSGPLGDANTEWTILAPTNDAFEDLLKGLGMTVDDLLKDRDLLASVLSFHVVPAAAVRASAFINGQSYATALQGASINAIRRSSGTLRISAGNDCNSANVVVTNIRAGKSIIHVIDTVLLPSNAKK